MHVSSVIIRMNDGKITCRGTAHYNVEKNGMYSWYLPGFEMYFSSMTKEEGLITAKAMSKSFFIYWIEKEKNFNQLILEITKLGFKTVDHRNTVNKMLQGKKYKANFETKARDEKWVENAQVEELELEVA